MEYKIKTKFDVDDIVYGFVDGKVHELTIDRIDVKFERFDKENPNFTRYETAYLATTKDAEFNCQHRFKEGTLFTEEEIIQHVNEYFENRKNS